MRQYNVVDLRRRASPSSPAPQLPFSPRKQRTPLRARRRRTHAFLALAALILLAGFAWAVSYTSYLPRFSVGSVGVVGTQNVPPRLIAAYAQTQLYDGTHPLLSRDNIFLYNPGRLAREIVGYFPRIKTASVSRTSMLATAIEVAIVERQPFALWCDARGACYQMDDTGFVFASTFAKASADKQATSTNVNTTPSTPSGYTFVGGIATSSSPIGQSFVPAHLPGILVLLQSLAQAGFLPQGASVDNDQDFSVPLQNGFYIKASFGEDAGLLVKNLQLVLSSDTLQGKADQIEYIDLRFGDKVYYKLKGASQTAVSQ